ncbi:MAG: serine/threonine-protein kinase, partial [bacterium]
MAASTRLGRYELLARIAIGGMGEIFLALRGGAAGFEKLCVIKRILPHLADDDRFRAMLIAEARIASSMSHANICHVYELEESDQQLYLVMEYLEGVTLLQLLCAMAERDQRLALGCVAGVIQQACEGLHYAHELRDRAGTPFGVVHRDITPSNLFVTDSGVLKIVDFGIAKVQDANESRSGAAKGKYGYMAPEQVRGRPVDRRADVFSVGVVTYELLTTRRLYQRTTDYLTLRAMMAPPDLQVAQHRPDAPAALEPVLLRALARNPEGRYPTVRQLEAALLGALGDVRPWGQAEISELVGGLFADRLRLTNVEISRVRELARHGFDRPIPMIFEPAAQGGELEDLAIEVREDPSAEDE